MKRTQDLAPTSHSCNSNEVKITTISSSVATKNRKCLHFNEASQALQEQYDDSYDFNFPVRSETCNTIQSNESVGSSICSNLNIKIEHDQIARGKLIHQSHAFQTVVNEAKEQGNDSDVVVHINEDLEDSNSNEVFCTKEIDELNLLSSSSYLQLGENYQHPCVKIFRSVCRICCYWGCEGCFICHSYKGKASTYHQSLGFSSSIILNDDVKNNGNKKHETKNPPNNNMGSTGHMPQMIPYSTYMIAGVIILLGILASIGFVTVGLMSESKQRSDEFHNYATFLSHDIYKSFEEYVSIASFVHVMCNNHNFSRDDFTDLYQKIRAGTALGFKAIQFVPFVPHSKRSDYENEMRAYLKEQYPNISYQGFIGFNELNSTKLELRSNQSFYFPNHYVEPVTGNEAAIDLDVYSSPSRIRAINDVYLYKKPIISDRIKLVQSDPNQPGACDDHNGPSFAIFIMSPGINSHNTTLTSIPTESSLNSWPRDIVRITVCIPDFLLRSTVTQFKSATMYIHDLSHAQEGLSGVFLGGVRLDVHNGHHPIKENIIEEQTSMSPLSNTSSSRHRTVKFVDEISLYDLRHFDAHAGHGISRTLLHHEQIISVANRIWSVTIISNELGQFGEATHQILPFIIVYGVILLLASIAVAAWVLYDSQRLNQLHAIQIAANQKRAALILENAKRATEAERELNDFLAHEVRNPVAAAIAACNFLKMELFKDNPIKDEQSKQLARDDVNIIDNSLNFVNDLLRNMLDMHRATANKLQIDWKPTYVLNDVLEPVSAMLHQRDGQKVRLIVECCPNDLCFLTDPMRLKQILINLGRNSCKFINSGFIRLSAFVDPVDGCVVLHVDDSGCGIPLEKRDELFSKYQSSLDLLSQGKMRWKASIQISCCSYDITMN